MKLKEHLLLAIISTFLFSCAPQPIPEIRQEIQVIEVEQRSITVSGSGEVKVAPDFAEVIFGIYTANKELNIARQENNEITRAILEVLEAHNIPEKDIKVDDISLFSIAAESSSDIYRYEAKNAVKVTVHDLLKLELITSEVLKTPGSRLFGVYFRISEPKKYGEEARELAIQSAQEKAQKMAGVLGQELDVPLSIQEFGSYQDGTGAYPLLLRSNNDYGGFNFNQLSAVSFGEIKIMATVNIIFGLK